MSSRILMSAVLAACVAMCTWFFVGEDQSIIDPPLEIVAEEAPSTQPVRATPILRTGSDPSELNRKSRAFDWKTFAALTGGDGDGSPKPTGEQVARFLAKHGETPVNLVAAFGVTRDRELVQRALELFPGSPIVLMAAIEAARAGADPKPGETYQPDAERIALIERFKAADPSNPLPWIFSAQELFKAKQTGEAVAAIRAAIERPAFYTYANERMDGARLIFEDIGLSPVESSFLAMVGLTLPHMGAAHQSSRGLMEWQKAAADGGDTAAVDEALLLTYNLGRTFATPEASRTAHRPARRRRDGKARTRSAPSGCAARLASSHSCAAACRNTKAESEC